MPSNKPEGQGAGGWAFVAVLVMVLLAGGGWLVYAAFPTLFASALQVMTGGPSYPAINPDDKTQVAVGARVYAAQCAYCHGANGQGDPDWRTKNPDGTLKPPPHDGTGHTWHHPNAMLFRVVKEGGQSVAPPGFTSAMPAFGGTLSDDEIAAVLAFIESKWPESIRLRRRAMQARR